MRIGADTPTDSEIAAPPQGHRGDNGAQLRQVGDGAPVPRPAQGVPSAPVPPRCSPQ